eukprot:TRINITY_DN17832_c0_g1_i1.p1 TRINITY_DN17832_c0_g1~~TRINITY_DN17832_c0_g1_i1.p1  ORF type:complete len:1215 (-),score=478.94 TRINITY_DN17832_c0_g1_i1:131-3775(-)
MATEEAATVPAVVEGEGQAASSTGPNGEPQPEQKKRGKPKDPNAPPKPKNAFQQVTGEARAKIKAERPELAMDLKAMGLALKEAYEAVPQEEKDRLTAEYEAKMEVWRPLWAAYKETEGYKEWFDLKQDWLDGREKRKHMKAHAKVAPKKPKSGYMIYAGEIRERVQKEVMDAGGGMGDIGKKISEYWGALSEAKKAEYGEISARQKEVFNVEYAKHKKTDVYKKYCEEKAKMEGRHSVKKLERTKLKDAPKRPASSFTLFKRANMQRVCEENKGAAVAVISRKLADMWKEASDDVKKPLEAEAAKLKEAYDDKLKGFKRQKVYLQFLTQRHKVRSRENRMVNLAEMPKKPKSVFALFKEDHKEEVPAGKGEGKGMSWVRAKFQEVADEEKQKYLDMEKELKAKHLADVQQFKDSDKFKEFEKTELKIKKEMQNEGMKVMTIKFLNMAPAAPPKTPFAVFVGEKRKASDEPAGKKPDKKARAAEIEEMKKEWVKLDKETKLEYEDKRKKSQKAWQDEVKAYMEQPCWKEYIQEAKELKVPVKSLLSQKSKALKKLKSGLVIRPLPDKPDELPGKPPSAKRLYIRKMKDEGADVTKLQEMWNGLSAEDKKPFEEEATELYAKYEEQLRAFETSEDGKAYHKQVAQELRRRRVGMIKVKYLKEVPKKPLSAVTMFMKKEFTKVKAESKGMSTPEIKALLKERWTAMDDETKAPLLEEAKKADEEYTETMKMFKSSENYKSYAKAMKSVNKKPKVAGAKKGKVKPTVSLPKKPEGMPKKPPDAMKLFMQEQAGQGKGLGELAKMFREISAEERARLVEAAKEKQADYQKAMDDFNKSEEGKKYNKEVKIASKRKRLADAKFKFLEDEPKKPVIALMIFASEKRGQIAAAHPEVKGKAVLGKVAEVYKNLPDEEKQVYIDKEKEGRVAYNQAMEEFKKSANYKKYQAAVSKINSSGPKAKGKGKGSSSKVSGPPVPANMPKKPPNGMMLFAASKRAEGISMGLSDQGKAWRELGAEGQKPFVDEAKEKNNEYEKAMREFRASAEGKKYLRLQEGLNKKKRGDIAKKKLLDTADAPKEPQRPPSAYQLFVQEKRSGMNGKAADIAKELTAMWTGLTAEEKKVFSDKFDEAKKEYEKAMVAYKANPAVKKYEAAMRAIHKTKKTKPKPKPKAAKKPAKVAKKAPGKAAPKKKAAADSDSDSDVMGSDDSSNSSSSDSDSD